MSNTHSEAFIGPWSIYIFCQIFSFDPLRKGGGKFPLKRSEMAKKPFFLRCWPQIGRYNQNKSFSKQPLVVLGQVEVADYEKKLFKALFCIFRAKIAFEVTLDPSKEVLLPYLQYYGLLPLEVCFRVWPYVWMHNFWLRCCISATLVWGGGPPRTRGIQKIMKNAILRKRSCFNHEPITRKDATY